MRRFGDARVRLIAVVALLLATTILSAVGPNASTGSAKPRAESSRSRIVGGRPVANGKYPFQAALLDTRKKGNDYDRQYCAGSLISPTFILTAAHCTAAAMKSMRVVVGRTVLTDARQGQKFSVVQVYKHPLYRPGKTGPSYDMALLELNQPVVGITPVSLPASGSLDYQTAQSVLTVIGWGNVNRSNPAKASPVSFPDRLQEVNVPVTTPQLCQRAYRFKETQLGLLFCAGSQRVDSCQGDSGGPIFKDVSGSILQLGVVSTGYGCAQDHFPGVYTRLSAPEIRAFILEKAGV